MPIEPVAPVIRMCIIEGGRGLAGVVGGFKLAKDRRF